MARRRPLTGRVPRRPNVGAALCGSRKDADGGELAGGVKERRGRGVERRGEREMAIRDMSGDRRPRKTTYSLLLLT